MLYIAKSYMPDFLLVNLSGISAVLYLYELLAEAMSALAEVCNRCHMK